MEPSDTNPKTKPSVPKGAIQTFRLTGILFLLSAIFEILCCLQPVLHFGKEQTGLIAFVYHASYCALFTGMGLATYYAKSWGPKFIYGATFIYAIDRIVFVITGTGELEFNRIINRLEMLTPYREIIQMEQQMFLNAMNWIYVVIILCWIGFAGYVYWYRRYFSTNSTL